MEQVATVDFAPFLSGMPDGKRATKGNLPLAIVYASALT